MNKRHKPYKINLFQEKKYYIEVYLFYLNKRPELKITDKQVRRSQHFAPKCHSA